ncbi:hypothetical protein LZ30DRAFT_109228 [Colletotrichum cereale]|nr:hypothetical protein LZ30DRAFT_109228 [Colletotrichum cereale]
MPLLEISPRRSRFNTQQQHAVVPETFRGMDEVVHREEKASCPPSGTPPSPAYGRPSVKPSKTQQSIRAETPPVRQHSWSSVDAVVAALSSGTRAHYLSNAVGPTLAGECARYRKRSILIRDGGGTDEVHAWIFGRLSRRFANNPFSSVHSPLPSPRSRRGCVPGAAARLFEGLVWMRVSARLPRNVCATPNLARPC